MKEDNLTLQLRQFQPGALSRKRVRLCEEKLSSVWRDSMHRVLTAAALGIMAFASLGARGEVLTAKIGGRTVTYVVTSGQRGPELSREEILNSLRNAKPATVVSVPQASGPDIPKDR